MHINYRLEQPILHLLWGLVDMFFGYNFPKPEPICMDEIWNIIIGGHGAHSHKKNGGYRPRCQNVFCFLLSMQRGLSATYPAPISTIFETTDVNRLAHAYTGEKFSNFCAGGFPGPQNSPK